jgi:polysaccharide biosynthesis transport protein
VEASHILSVIRQWGWVLVLSAVIAGAAGHLATSALPVMHEARVRLLVGPVPADNDEIRAAGSLTRTYGELVTGEDVVQNTIEQLGLPHSPGQLRSAIRATADGGTRMLIVRVRDLDADVAALIADEVARQLERLFADGSLQDGAGELRVIDRASPGSPVGISGLLIASLAGFAGLVAALTLVILLENLRQTIRTPEELTAVSGVDYLGSVSMAGRPTAPRGFAVEIDPDSPRAADYRMLATKAELIAGRDGLRSLLVLGVGSAQGSGELMANIGKTLSERRHAVTLIDANVEAAEVTTLLGLGGRPGLTELLEQYEQFDEAELHPESFTFSRDPRLFVIPFGRKGNQGPPHSSRAPILLAQLLRQADFLLLNAAPAHRSATSLVWAGAADGTVLVVPRNRTKRGELTHLVESLRLVGTNLIGVVFEERHRWLRTVGTQTQHAPHYTERWHRTSAPATNAAETKRAAVDGLADPEAKALRSDPE